MMLAELTQLLSSCPRDATKEDYRQAVIEENVLGKRTTSNRKLSFLGVNSAPIADSGFPFQAGWSSISMRSPNPSSRGVGSLTWYPMARYPLIRFSNILRKTARESST